jgi:hypothetical protein
VIQGHESWQSELPLVGPADRRHARRWRKQLTMEQVYALRRYAGSAFAPLNAALRSIDDPRFATLAPDELGEARTLDQVLAEIPPVRARTALTVWRGSALPAHIGRAGRWTDPAWVSCSFDQDHARYAAQSSPENARGQLIELQLDAGCEYLPLSLALAETELPNEHEILLTPGHRFQVVRDGSVACVRVHRPWELIER